MNNDFSQSHESDATTSSTRSDETTFNDSSPNGSAQMPDGTGDNSANGTDQASQASFGEEAARVVAENEDRFLRAVAELENFKRQAARRETEARERASRNVIEDLLPVLDNFERALEAARTAKDVEGVRMGIEFIAQQLRDALKGHGVESIEALGQKFDPLKHDALEEVAESGHPEGTVLSEAQRGYLYKGQVLRPSRVRVAGK